MEKRTEKKVAAVFRDDIITHVSTCALIEDYQDLVRASTENDWDLVETVAECLAETIDRFTTVPSGLKIKPSGSSVINMPYENGILTMPDGSDLRCEAGKPVSFAMSGGYFQCDNSCPYFANGKCSPEDAILLLAGGFTYHGADSCYSDDLGEYLGKVPVVEDNESAEPVKPTEATVGSESFSHVEYGGFATIQDTGEEKLIFTTDISERLCWNRTREKIEEAASHADGFRIVPDSIVVKRRTVRVEKEAWFK